MHCPASNLKFTSDIKIIRIRIIGIQGSLTVLGYNINGKETPQLPVNPNSRCLDELSSLCSGASFRDDSSILYHAN